MPRIRILGWIGMGLGAVVAVAVAVGDMLSAVELPGSALLGGSLFALAAKSNQKTRRLSGWLSISRWQWFGRLWSPVTVIARSTLLRSRDVAFVDGLLNEPEAGDWPPAKRVIGGTPSAALRALSIVGRGLGHGVRRCARPAPS